MRLKAQREIQNLHFVDFSARLLLPIKENFEKKQAFFQLLHFRKNKKNSASQNPIF